MFLDFGGPLSDARPFSLLFPFWYFCPFSARQPRSCSDNDIAIRFRGSTYWGAAQHVSRRNVASLMVQWSPDTNTDAWYQYGEKWLYGFSLTHVSGSGMSALRGLCRTAGVGCADHEPGERSSLPLPFDRKDEQAHPGYYAVTLTNGVHVELTVAERAGVARFTYPAGEQTCGCWSTCAAQGSIPFAE